MDKFDQKLFKVCYKVAEETMYKMKPMSLRDIEKLAMVFYTEANEFREFIDDNTYDPKLLVRAVSYLAHTHARPSSRRDSTWFRDQLMVLIEMACPNVIHTKESAEFFKDVLKGISISKGEILK